MADNSSSDQVQWKVTGQAERTVIDATGSAVNVMQVTFTLANGTTGTVNVPLGQYNPATVRQMIAEKAATIAAVADLAN